MKQKYEKFKMKNPFLIGEKIYLRAPENGDEEIVALSENHPEPRANLYYTFPTNLEIHADRLKQKQNDHTTIYFIICTKENDKPIGATAFVRIDWIGRMATFYIAIAESENWNKGYGKEATKLMTDYAFATLNLNRIQLHVSKENNRAIDVYEKIGFVKEGELREAMYFDSHYIDFYVMGILKKDWENLKSKRK
jgi:RimJ/RimL family protein N-acetyltransferase